MTQSLAQINNGAAYADGNVLPPETVNLLTSNTEIAWQSAVAAMSRPVWLGSLGWSSTPKVIDGLLWALGLSLDENGNTEFTQLVITQSGATVDSAVTGIGVGFGTLTLAYNPTAHVWGAWPLDASVYMYVSTGDYLTDWDAPAPAVAAVSTLAAIYEGGASPWFFSVGSNAGGTAAVIVRQHGVTGVYNATFTNANATTFSDIASNGEGTLVAVGPGAFSRSTDSGQTWTHSAMAAPTGNAGYTSISWDAASARFICTAILSTGAMAWTTSTTGATWQPWQRTSQTAIAPAALASISGPQTGITAVGNTWCAPYVTGSASFFVVGLMVSVDRGSSWTVIPGGGIFNTCDYMKVLAVDNRAAVVSRGAVMVSGPVTAGDKGNSVAV